MTTYSKRLAIASTNAFARGAPRKEATERGNWTPFVVYALIQLFVESVVSGRLNDHLFRGGGGGGGGLDSPHHSRVNKIIRDHSWSHWALE